MNGRRILVIAATAMCWVAASGCGPASAERVSSGFDSGGEFDRAGTLNAVPDLPTAVEAILSDQNLGTNPLWGIPLRVLSVTRDRPLFSPLRRPPAAAVISPPVKAANAVRPSAPSGPRLSLVGTVEGNSEGYAVFIDTITQNVVRLKTGQGENGWILRSVSEREAVLYNNDRTEVLDLPSIPRLPRK